MQAYISSQIMKFEDRIAKCDIQEQSGREWGGGGLRGGGQGERCYLERLLKAAVASLLGCQGALALILTPSEW